jgi:Ca-activated chloride channel family protein
VSFATPVLLLLFPAAAIAAAIGGVLRRRGPALLVADASPLRAAARPTWRLRLRRLPTVLRWLAIALLVVAIARPREGLAVTTLPEEGIDIVVTVDVSSSMTTPIGPGATRLSAARTVVDDFVRGLTGDRVGLVVFQSRALTLSPLTLDRAAIAQRLDALQPGLLEDGTAIGLGVAEALNLLRDSPAQSRVVVLLTDGDNNAGEVEPLTAARLATALDVRLYTIGFVAGPGSSLLDVRTLREMAESTDGRYYDASTQEQLAAAYDDIGRLERSRVGERRFIRFRELASPLIAGALALLAVEYALRAGWLRRYP